MIRIVLVGMFVSLAFPFCADAQDEWDLSWRGYAQLTAERDNGSGNTLAFDAERVRPRIVIDKGRLRALMQLDFAVDDLGDSRTGTLANVILDLYASYELKGRHTVRFGQYKTPIGMDYNMPAHQLDITKRGMDAGLILNRDFGVMLTGREVLGGLSYDIGLFNPPGRSGATNYLDSQEGQATGQVARLRYDRAVWHAELAHGIAEEAGGPNTPDYSVSNFAVSYSSAPWTVKAEWTEGQDVRGVAGREETVHYLHITRELKPGLEFVARHYTGKSRVASATTELDNTYVGVTKHFASQSRLQTRLQANYVFANGDRSTYSGLRGFREDALLVQLLFYFES